MIKNYILYNEDGTIKQFTRCDEIEIEMYQSSYIELEEDSFEFDPSKTYKVENKRVVSYDREDKSYLLTKLNTEFEDSVAQLTSSTPQSEISTWIKQESEAREWLKDNSAVTPLIDAICTNRGVEKDYLVSKIIEKSDAYAVALGELTGLRQKQEKLILEGDSNGS